MSVPRTALLGSDVLETLGRTSLLSVDTETQVSHPSRGNVPLVLWVVLLCSHLCAFGLIPTQAQTEILQPDSTSSMPKVVEQRLKREAVGHVDDRTSVALELPKLEAKSGSDNLNLRGDTKAAYQQVASLFGIKVIFDPELAVRNVRLSVEDVDFYTALSLLQLQTGTFWRTVAPNTIFVASDTPEKRRLYAIEGERTFSLAETVDPADTTELLRVLRDIAGAAHIGQDSRGHTITVRGTPEQLQLAGALIQQIEEPRDEVMLEIELLEVDRNKATQLGIGPPSSLQLISLSPSELAKLRSSTDLANLLTNLAQILTAKGVNTTSVVPLGGGLSTFLLTVPSIAANFSDSHSLVQSRREIMLRAQDGKPATFFLGERYPVNLSQLSNISGKGSNATPSGTTFPVTSFPVGKNPSALVANTFTGGTLPDLAVANRDDNSIIILQNQDNGNFTQTSSSPIELSKAETGPVAMATGVFRNDGAKFSTTQPPDLVIVNSTSNNISILLGGADSNGLANGTFAEARGSPISVAASPSSVVVADFNGDGFLDIAVANQSDNSISLFRGRGDGTFTEFPGSPFKLTNTSSISEKAPIAMASANFRNKTLSAGNGASEIDLAVVNQGSNNLTILLTSVDANQDVSFTEASGSPIAVGTSPVAIATADLNADGIPDLAIVNQADSSVTVLLGSSNLDATFSAADGSPLQTGATPAGIVIANFANSAVPDLAVTNGGVSTIGVYVGQGQGTFSSRIELNVPSGPTALITSILSSSGLPDVALVAQDANSSKGVAAVILDSSSFANGNGGAGQIPYPGGEFVDLGVKAKVTAKLHANHEVTLQLEFEIRALSGSTVNGIPVISNRSLSQTVRFREDEAAVIGGLEDREASRSISGLPGLATIPGGVGYAFGTRNNSMQDNELLIVITPLRLRETERISRRIYAGRGDQTAGARGEHSPPQAPESPPQESQPQPPASMVAPPESVPSQPPPQQFQRPPH